MNFEKILDDSAKESMTQWSLESFKKSHPTLLKTILNSMQDVYNKCKNQR